MHLEAVIFDMDGVVTRTAGLHVRAWTRLFDEYLGARRDRGEIHRPFDPVKDYLAWVDGKPRYDGVQSFLESRGIDMPFGRREDGNDAETTCGLGNRKDEYFEEMLNAEGVRVYESTLERIAQLRALGVRTALGTSSRHGGRIMRMAGITDQFDVIADGNTIRERSLKGKPSPDLFLEAARELGIPPARIAVVEDAVAGVEAGRRGGFARVVGVNRGDNQQALQQAGADVVVDDLAELSAADLLTPHPRQATGGEANE
ncbi:MAG: beta-phosphoglucomutase family hydrolase [Acidobacteria bacterium]|jgi:beta-phosphoglucomutase family hydrolase|nr:beta-phosphoglucomutase family hydrolase [Acidobacteriota bacterium]